MRAARRVAIAGAVVVSLAGLGGCGGDDNGGGDNGGAAVLNDNERRYCELTAEVESRAEEAFSGLSEDASEEEVGEVQSNLLADVDDELDEMVEVAPEEISGDVETFVASFRAQMSGEDGEHADDSAIVAWEEENCPS